MKADNLFRYKGGYDSDGLDDKSLYALVLPDSDYRGTDGVWEPGVVYAGIDGRIRSTTRARWDERFEPVAEYTGESEDVIAMIRRTQPREEFDLGDVITAWHESESATTSELLRLMAATLALAGRFKDEKLPEIDLHWDTPISDGALTGVSFVVEPAHLAYVSANYEIEIEPRENGYWIGVGPPTG